MGAHRRSIQIVFGFAPFPPANPTAPAVEPPEYHVEEAKERASGPRDSPRAAAFAPLERVLRTQAAMSRRSTPEEEFVDDDDEIINQEAEDDGEDLMADVPEDPDDDADVVRGQGRGRREGLAALLLLCSLRARGLSVSLSRGGPPCLPCALLSPLDAR